MQLMLDLCTRRSQRSSFIAEIEQLIAVFGAVQIPNTFPDDGYSVLHGSTRVPGRWQLSYLDNRGAVGHDEFDDVVAAAMRMFTDATPDARERPREFIQSANAAARPPARKDSADATSR